MNPKHRPNDRQIRIDLAAARYLEALEAGDAGAIEAIWALAEGDAEMTAALEQVVDGLIEEQQTAAADIAGTVLVDAVAEHFPSATIAVTPTGPVTIAEVAEALFRMPPAQLPGDVHQINDKLRKDGTPLPDDLGLSKFVAWAESRFGSAPRSYWKALAQKASQLRLERAASELGLAARKAPPGGSS